MNEVTMYVACRHVQTYTQPAIYRATCRTISPAICAASYPALRAATCAASYPPLSSFLVLRSSFLVLASSSFILPLSPLASRLAQPATRGAREISNLKHQIPNKHQVPMIQARDIRQFETCNLQSDI